MFNLNVISAACMFTMLLVVTPAIAEGGVGRAAGLHGGRHDRGIGHSPPRSIVVVGPGYGYYAGPGYYCGPSGTYLGYDGQQHLCPSSFLPQ